MHRYTKYLRDILAAHSGRFWLWLQMRTVPSWFGHYVARALATAPLIPNESFEMGRISWTTKISPQSVLAREGILVAKTNLNKRIASETVKRVESLIEQLESGVSPEEMPGKLGVAHPSVPYGKIAEAGQPMAMFRDGVDAGMVDIFHANQVLPELDAEVKRVVKDWNVAEILEGLTNKKYRLRNFNVYLNRSVTATRGWHVDSYGSFQFKVFLYLTDVNDEGDGPYCYVAGTSSSKQFARVNKILSRFRGVAKTDITLFPGEDAIMLLGGAGTMVASNQSGAHRGFPQLAGRKRCIVALNLIPE